MPDPSASFEALIRLSQAVVTAPDALRATEALLDALVEATGAELAMLIHLEGDARTVRAARGAGRLAITAASPPEAALRQLVTSRQATFLPETTHGAARESATGRSSSARAVALAPLFQRGELLGALYLEGERSAAGLSEGGRDLLGVCAAQASLLLQNAVLGDALRRESVALREAVAVRQYGDLIGAGAGMREVYRRIERVAATDVSVLIGGETGTGKEVAAREIHRRSTRAEGPFVAVSCGAIPEELLESELFGHVKGSFTGATANRVGKFQSASGGTLFLDEIGEMPGSLQVKLLRALQDRAVTRVGDDRADPVDIRVLAATHRVLEEEIRRGTFREDLYYRLNVVTIRLPPLRERVEDVPMLGKFFLQKYAREFSSKVRGFTTAALVAMKKYAWPGNIRELENRVKKAVVLAEKTLVGPEDLDLHADELTPILPLARAKEEFQRHYINEVLERNGGNRTKTARDLGVDPRTIFRHLECERETHGGAEEPPRES